MARKNSKAKRRPLLRFVLRWLLRGTVLFVVLGTAWIALYAVVAPPTTPYMLSEADDATILAAMIADPGLVERPIVVVGKQAAICRPPERVRELLDKR